MKSTHDRSWSTEGWVGILVTSISSFRITRYSREAESHQITSGTQPPPSISKRGVELIFHSFPNPPLHPSLIRLPDSPHPAPARRQPVPATPSATSGRKLTNEKAPPAITSRLHPTVKLYRICSFHYISPPSNTVTPCSEGPGSVRWV